MMQGLADPVAEVTEPLRSLLETSNLPPTQPVEVVGIIVLITPSENIVVADTRLAIILGDTTMSSSNP